MYHIHVMQAAELVMKALEEASKDWVEAEEYSSGARALRKARAHLGSIVSKEKRKMSNG